MSNFARIINDVAIDVSSDPENQFHPDIAAEFVSVPDSVVPGSTRDRNGNWAPPAAADSQPAPVEAPKVSPVEFKLLFTPKERVAIKAARGSDPVIEDFFDIVEDPRLTHVDLGLQSTKDGIAYLASKNLLTQARATEILTGTLK
jgi:hypothetical protein